MKRDLGYMRTILLEYEAEPSFLVVERLTLGMDAAVQKRWQHVQLLCDAGLLHAVKETTFRITNEGHDFLDSIRDDRLWTRVKDRIAQHGGNWTMDVLKAVALDIFKGTF